MNPMSLFLNSAPSRTRGSFPNYPLSSHTSLTRLKLVLHSLWTEKIVMGELQITRWLMCCTGCYSPQIFRPRKGWTGCRDNSDIMGEGDGLVWRKMKVILNSGFFTDSKKIFYKFREILTLTLFIVVWMQRRTFWLGSWVSSLYG
jgi:hypothetical protein